jgi:Tfp pilus assembly protein PilF
MRENKLQAARRALRHAIECMPDQLASYNVLAWLEIFEQDYAAARRTLEQCLDKDRNFGETHGTLAVLAALENDWDEAERLAATAVRLDADSFAGRYAQSLILKHRGKPERGDQLLASILKGADLPGGGTLFDAMQRFMARR